MIVLDTNVVSELMRPAPAAAVVAWIGRQSRQQFCTTSLTEAELRYGVALLPHGRRRDAVARGVDALFRADFRDRVLPFDSAAAGRYAEIAQTRREVGRPISQFDAQIAAVARTHGATLATRNVADFEGCGVDVVDPWSASR